MQGTTTALTIIAIALVLVILLQEVRHSKERRDLYNRLMARDLADYHALERPPADKGRVRNFVFTGMKRNLAALESQAREGD